MANGMWLTLAAAILMSAGVCRAADVKQAPGSARLDKWTVIGPGGGGAQFRPVVSPFDASKVFVSCDMTGTYVTEDAGASWRMINLRGVTDFVVFDPVDKNVVYAHSIGLWRSADGGRTWALVQPAPEDVKGVIYSGDHAQERLDTRGKRRRTCWPLRWTRRSRRRFTGYSRSARQRNAARRGRPPFGFRATGARRGPTPERCRRAGERSPLTRSRLATTARYMSLRTTRFR